MKKSITLGYCCAAALAGGVIFSPSPSLRAAETGAITDVITITPRAAEIVPGSAPASTAPVAAPTATPLDPVSIANIIPADVRFNHQLVELLRREIELNANRNNEMLVRQHERQIEALQATNRNMLIGVGAFAFISFAGLLSIIVTLMRNMNRMTEMAVAASQGRALPMATGTPAGLLGMPDSLMTSSLLPAQSTDRLGGAVGRLEQRIQELERAAQGPGLDLTRRIANPTPATPAAPAPASPMVSAPMVTEMPATHTANITSLPSPAIRPISPMAMTTPPPPVAMAPAPAPASTPAPAAKSDGRHLMGDINFLFNKGQSLLQSGDATGALQCFEQMLELQPNHGEAMVKRGMALEKLDRLENALEAYTRAVAIDPSLTVAYLYKGGVCNRLQRHREALECYEQALRAEHKTRVS